MDVRASNAPQHDRTRFLLVDTDNLFLDGVGTSLKANEDADVVATARCIEDAYDSAARHDPDVIVVGWGAMTQSFVRAAAASAFSSGAGPLIVVVLPRGITGIAGLGTLTLTPNVTLVVIEQLEKLLLRHTSSRAGMQLH